jgi:hypothetical protein
MPWADVFIADEPGLNDYMFWNADVTELIRFYSIQVFKSNKKQK